MKITREGQVPTATVPWWAGKTAECRRCGCQAELEEGDVLAALITPHAERSPEGRQWVEGQCPTPGCGGRLALQKV